MQIIKGCFLERQSEYESENIRDASLWYCEEGVCSYTDSHRPLLSHFLTLQYTPRITVSHSLVRKKNALHLLFSLIGLSQRHTRIIIPNDTYRSVDTCIKLIELKCVWAFVCMHAINMSQGIN